MQEGGGRGGWGAIIICASDKSVLSFLLCLWRFRALGWCFETLRRAGPSPSFSEKCVRLALSGLPDLKKNTVLGGGGEVGDIMKGVALRLSLPPFVRRFVSLRQVSRLSNLPLLIFCDTHRRTTRQCRQGEINSELARTLESFLVASNFIKRAANTTCVLKFLKA